MTRLKLHGDVAGIARAFRQLPHRKLVVIGAPGSGKTSLAVLLVEGLLAEPVPGEPVPVLVDLSGWIPSERFDIWLARQLGSLYPFLSPETAGGLVERERVLPVLDGLDEMPESLRPEALGVLRDALGGRRPFVLTCRAQEYQNLMSEAGVPLARAAVIEIEPVGVAELVAYLPGRHINGEGRWAGVTAELIAHPREELARGLSSPLMAFLARTAYDPPAGRPGDLLHLSDHAAVQRHLLAAYLPAIYQQQLTAATRRRRPYEPADAERWLRFLARELRRRQTSTIAWWEIWRAVPPRLHSVTLAVIAVLGSWVAPLLTGGHFINLGWMATTTFLVGFLAFFREVGRAPIRPSLWAAAPFLVVAAFSASIGLVLTWENPVAELLFAVGFLPVSIIIASVGVLRSPPTDPDQATPGGSLVAERVSAGVVLGLTGLAALTSFAYFDTWATGLNAGLAWPVFAFVIMIIVRAPGTAWAEFDIARAYLVSRGHLPFRLMAFVKDAHRRGVLRQVGAVYQFRHARLQAYLAEE